MRRIFKNLTYLLLSSTIIFYANLCSAQFDIQAKGLFKGRAILSINGSSHMLKVGERSPEGVLLVSADTHKAVIEYNGSRQTLSLSRRIAASFQAAEKAEVRLQSSHGGHYVTQAQLNGRNAQVMVDTGATVVAMSLPTAKALGINYENGTLTQVSTAGGITQGYRVMLNSVSIGNVRADNVEAIVNMSDFPAIILLGNSFLDRVEMSRTDGILILRSKF